MVAEAWRGPSLNLIHGVGSVPQILPEPASRPISLPPPFPHSFLYHRPRGYSQCPETTHERYGLSSEICYTAFMLTFETESHLAAVATRPFRT